VEEYLLMKRGRIWYVRLQRDGKDFWKSTKTEKVTLAREIRDKILSGIKAEEEKREIPPEQRLTFKQFVEKWEQIKTGSVKPSTMSRYKNIITCFLEPQFGDKPFSQITTQELVEFASERMRQVAAPKTAINQIALLKMIFREARRWGYLKIDPAVEVERPRNRDHEIEILTPKELSLLIVNSEYHYRTAFRTAIMTGVRAGELWGLQWPDFQPATKQLYIRRTVWNGQFQTPKTKNAKRAIDLPDELVHELRIWRPRCPPNEHNLMFPSPERSITQHDNMMKRIFIPALQKAGLRQVSFHSLRHSNASIRIKKGQNLKYLSKQMGHSSVAFTLDVYGHLFKDDQEFLREQAGLLAGALPAQTKEQTKSDSSKTIAKTVAVQKKGSRPLTQPLDLVGSGARFELATFGL
jgi:integrase